MNKSNCNYHYVTKLRNGKYTPQRDIDITAESGLIEITVPMPITMFVVITEKETGEKLLYDVPKRCPTWGCKCKRWGIDVDPVEFRKEKHIFKKEFTASNDTPTPNSVTITKKKKNKKRKRSIKKKNFTISFKEDSFVQTETDNEGEDVVLFKALDNWLPRFIDELD